MLSSGERVDILIDFSSLKTGEQVYLVNETFSTMGTSQGADSFKILDFVVKNQETDTFKMPTSLIPVPKITGSTKTRKFVLTGDMMAMSGGMHKINGKVYDGNRIDETVSMGAIETWEFDNSTGDEAHPMHIHGVEFQVVSRSGGRNTILPQE
eukprot:Opistho-2@31090